MILLILYNPALFLSFKEIILKIPGIKFIIKGNTNENEKLIIVLIIKKI